MRTRFTLAALALAVPGLLATTVPVAAAIHGAEVMDQRVGTQSDQTWNHGNRGRQRGWDRGRGRGHGGDDYGRSDSYERYEQPVYANTRVWQGDNGRYYCRREDGTTGLLIGAAVGGLIGHEVAGRGDRTLGVILGAAGGAILGRSIDRSNARCR